MAGRPKSIEEVPGWVDSCIKGHKVCVFSKSHCPYCTKAVDLLRKANAKDMHVEEIESNPFMNEIQDYLQKKTGARSVPRVFIGGEFIGGCDDTARCFSDGTLMRKLQEAENFDVKDVSSVERC